MNFIHLKINHTAHRNESANIVGTPIRLPQNKTIRMDI